ncbi:MAG: hypothetical protein GY841_11750 [FCB group bacterium]|nr:hypothetical protein [FCB group bacterium]
MMKAHGPFTFDESAGAWADDILADDNDVNSLPAHQVMHDALTAAQAEGSTSQVIDNTLTGANDATAASGEAVRGVTVRAPSPT